MVKMLLVVTSKPDIASMNILNNLLTIGKWDERGRLDGNPVYGRENTLVVTIDKMHLHFDDVDIAVKKELDVGVESVIYASKHRSQSGTRTLTVHPVGNYGEAEFGGKPHTLVPASPPLMTYALRALKERAKELKDYRVSFETTHHGPFLTSPVLFIEIGSNETAWRDEDAGRVIADTIMSLCDGEWKSRQSEYPVALGAGGGHYAPRISDVALQKKVSFGHMVPSYAVNEVLEYGEEMVSQMIEKSPGAEMVFVHRKGVMEEGLEKLGALFEKQGLRVVGERELGEA